jgi:hypothetical protein
MKKTIGIILIICAVLAFFGGIINGSFENMFNMSGARQIGNIVGTLLGYAALIIGGIVLIAKGNKE